jgi:hypothetical protein
MTEGRRETKMSRINGKRKKDRKEISEEMTTE